MFHSIVQLYFFCVVVNGWTKISAWEARKKDNWLVLSSGTKKELRE